MPELREAPKRSGKQTSFQGWVARKASLAIQEGALRITPSSQKGPVLVLSKFAVAGRIHHQGATADERGGEDRSGLAPSRPEGFSPNTGYPSRDQGCERVAGGEHCGPGQWEDHSPAPSPPTRCQRGETHPLGARETIARVAIPGRPTLKVAAPEFALPRCLLLRLALGIRLPAFDHAHRLSRETLAEEIVTCLGVVQIIVLLPVLLLVVGVIGIDP